MIQAQILRVVVASPGDVQRERDVASRVVEELNKSLASDRALRLEVIRWETDARPGFHPQGPQWLIDSVLRVEDSDIVIGIFWKRFGTPVEDADSGTEHELKLAYDAWKTKGKPQIMVYFNESSYAPTSSEETDQWGKVLGFKAGFPKEGLWWPYGDAEEFERLLRIHLMRLISGIFPVENRNEYLERYARLIQLAREEIILCTSKFHKSGDRPEAEPINTALREARARKVSVRILMADGYDRLPGALELRNDIGAEVRFDPAVHLADLNYICVDKHRVILAARKPTSTSETYVRSTSSVELQGSSLATALAREFENRWNALTTRTLGEQLREALPGMVRASSVETVARELRLSREVVESYRCMRPLTIFLIGRPGSGKTAVAERIIDRAAAIGLFKSGLHLNDFVYIRQVFASSESAGTRFQRTDDGGFFILDGSLYREALEYLASQASRAATKHDLLIVEFARNSYIEAFQVLSKCGLEPDVVIYLEVSLQTALDRNRMRAKRIDGDNHFVSEREMRETYATDDIKKVAEEHKTKTIVIRNEILDESPGEGSADLIIQTLKSRL